MNDSSVDINEVRGDVIGVNVTGSGNIIGKNINIVINEAKSLGLNLLSPKYFEEYKSTEVDFENWRKGFSFNKLPPIKENKEFKRTKLLEDIKNRLEIQHHLLLVGESGTSKSTILMEIICDYFDLGYKILYNFEDTKITQGTELIQFIQGLLTEGNKVLVAIDNAHDERAAVIFYVMDQLSNYILNKNIRFLITGRLPEYDWFVNRLGKMREDKYIESIKKFKVNPNFRYELPAFTKDEIKGFIIKYKELSTLKEDDYESVYNDTKGHPIMVKFSVLGEGLRNDAERRYEHYLYDRKNDCPDPLRIQTTLVCSLLDIANLQITDDILEKMKLLEFALELNRAILYYQTSEKLWKTIHPRWDTELISYLYSENERGVILQRKEYLKKSICLIFNIKDKIQERDQRTVSVVSALYGIMADGKIPVEIVEEAIEIPHYLNEETKCNLYVWTMASTYLDLERYEDAIAKCGLALELNNRFSDAWHIKGIALHHLNKYAEAIKCYEKAIDLDPYSIGIWLDKAESLQKLGRHKEAMKCYEKFKAIKPNLALPWYKKALSLSRSGKYDDAIHAYDKALEIDPENVDVWNNKGWALNELRKYDEAIKCYEQALATNSKNFNIWFNKGYALNELRKYDEAIKCYEQALEIDPADEFQYLTKFPVAWNNKGWALNELRKYDEAIKCYEQALEIDPKFPVAWNNKGWALTELSNVKEAEKCFAKAKRLGLKTYLCGRYPN